MFVSTHRKIYEIKYGLKGLILLSENSNLLAEDFRFVLYCGLISQQPNITFDEVDEILNECDLKDFVKPFIFLSPYEIAGLYTKAIGEIGMTLADFYASTPDEIDLAYEGYLRRKETEANLTKLAIISSNDDNLIRLTEDTGYVVGSVIERNEMFEKLNISEGL